MTATGAGAAPREPRPRDPLRGEPGSRKEGPPRVPKHQRKPSRWTGGDGRGHPPRNPRAAGGLGRHGGTPPPQRGDAHAAPVGGSDDSSALCISRRVADKHLKPTAFEVSDQPAERSGCDKAARRFMRPGAGTGGRSAHHEGWRQRWQDALPSSLSAACAAAIPGFALWMALRARAQSTTSAFIEAVTDEGSSTVQERRWCGARSLRQHGPSVGAPGQSEVQAAAAGGTCAAHRRYSILTYILQVKVGHNGNILLPATVTSSHRLQLHAFHLARAINFESARFKQWTA